MPASRKRFSIVKVDGLAHDPSGPSMQIHYEGHDIPGFGVRVFRSGAKSFVLWYRMRGGPARLMTLRRWPADSERKARTLREARKLASDNRGDVEAGIDPLDAKRHEREAATVREFAAVYLKQHAALKKSGKEDERRLNNYVIPALGQRKLASVTRADVARLHKRTGETKPYEANRVLSLLKTVFAKGQEWGYFSEQASNPARHVQPFVERSRDRYVTAAEMPAVFAAIEKEANPYVRAAFKLYLFTGLRRSELLSLRWSDIDLQQGRLRLEDTKAGRSHTLPLSPPAVEILNDLPRMLGNPYVLPGHVRGKPLVNVSVPWKRIRSRAGVEDVRLHDLRRTVGSWLAMAGASLPLIGKVLNHSNASTTQIYARLAEDAPREALDALAEKMLSASRR